MRVESGIIVSASCLSIVQKERRFCKRRPIIQVRVISVEEALRLLLHQVLVQGRFNIQGMRPGGPYTVSISYVGFQKKNYTDIKLALGEVFNLKAEISENANEIGEVVVSAQASKFANEKTGASTNISRQQIAEMPTANRSIQDIARLSPFANGMGLAGGDGR